MALNALLSHTGTPRPIINLPLANRLATDVDADLDVLFAVLENPSDEMTEAIKCDPVLPETMAILVAS